MRWLKRLAYTIVFLVVVAAGLAWWAGIEFGSRPPESIRPFEVAGDVRFVEANGIRFGYLEEGSGPLVLLFHGYPETARSWATVQRRLAAAGYRVVAPFMRGYAPSSAPPNGDYSVGALGLDVVALIDALGEDKAIVVGHDWGASAVYAAVAESPTRIAALVSLAIPHARGFAGDPTVFLDAPHFLYYQLPVAERLVWSHDYAHVEWIYREWAPSYQPPADVLADIKATLSAPGGVEGALGYYWSLFDDTEANEKRAAVNMPVPSLIIAGGADGAVGRERYEAARAAFTARYQYVELEGVGHFPQLEAPDKVADAIIAFLAVQD